MILSDHLVDPVGCTEAELMREIFVRVADGHSLLSECARLNAIGIPSTKGYSSRCVVFAGVQWRPVRLSDLLHNPVYTGQHIYRSKLGEIHLAVPALVDKELWDRAHEALRRNLSRPKSRDRVNVLRGLVKCQCGAGYVGTRGIFM